MLPQDTDSDLKLIRPLLAKTNLQFRPLQLAYSGSRDGWNPKAFHTKVDRKGPALVLCKTKSGAVCGGYNPCGWVNLGEYRGSIAAFLFTFPIKEKGSSSKVPSTAGLPVKLQKIAGAGLAQIDGESKSPALKFYHISPHNAMIVYS